MERRHVLFLWQGPCFMSGPEIIEEKLNYLSKYIFGDIIAATIKRDMHYDKLGEFRFHPISYKRTSIKRNLTEYRFVLKALKLFFIKKYRFEVIVSPNPLNTGLEALIIRIFTKAKVIVEINGNFEEAFKYGGSGMVAPSLMEKIKGRVSRSLIDFVVRKADVVKILNEKQIPASLRKKPNILKKVVWFPDYVATRSFSGLKITDDRYILFIGHPWYLKGVDILIKAFKKISSTFPNYKLKIIGWCPNGRDFFENLAKPNSNIELLAPLVFKDVPKVMAACSMFVLPSRTEAMGRVLIEAMACKKPVIASNVDGIPNIVKNNFNGLLFESENVDDLTDKIHMVLGDKNLADKLSTNAYKYLLENFTEEHYVGNFKNMLDKTFCIEKV